MNTRELTHEQRLAILRSDGILPAAKVARAIGRTKSAIDDFWRKFPQRPAHAMNGMPWEKAKLLSPHCPTLLTPAAGGTLLCTWADMLDVGLSTCDEWVQESIGQMAQFQLAIHQAQSSAGIREKLCRMIRTGKP